MNINPMRLRQLTGEWDQFKLRHPRLEKFYQAVQKKGLREGSVIEVTVTTPEGETLASNIRVTAEDAELIRDLYEMMK